MSDVSNVFIRQYESEVHLAFQDQGSHLLNTVRRTQVTGSTVQFPVMGTGEATTKARHGNVTPMNLDHTYVTGTMQDWYAPEYVDKLDELKINHNERLVVAKSAAFALGRKADDLIIAAAEGTSNNIAVTVGGGGAATGMNQSKADALIELFGNNDVFHRGGKNVVWVGFQQFTDLLGLASFASADYIGPDDMPFKDSQLQGRRWMGFDWYTHSRLSKSGTTRTCLAYNEYALGLGVGSEVKAEENYIAEKVSHLLNAWLSMGAVLIDEDGVCMIYCKESA